MNSNSIQLSQKTSQPTSQSADGNSEDLSTTNIAAPTAGFLLKTISFPSGAALAASLTLMIEVSISPLTTKTEFLASVVAMRPVALATGGAVISDMMNNYCRGSDPEVSVLHHAIRLFAVMTLGGCLMHLVLLSTSLALDGDELSIAAGVMAAVAGVFLVADTMNSYYPDGAKGCCNRAEFHKDERPMTIGRVTGEDLSDLDFIIEK